MLAQIGGELAEMVLDFGELVLGELVLGDEPSPMLREVRAVVVELGVSFREIAVTHASAPFCCIAVLCIMILGIGVHRTTTARRLLLAMAMAIALVTKLAIGATVIFAAASSRGAAGSTGSADGPAIVGGSPTSPGEWPDVVAVLGKHGSCTGTLVAPDAVLTAGHCAEIAPQRIVAGTTDYTHGGTAVEVAATIAYPNFGASYDVAVLLLATPLPGVTPRALATPCTFDRVAAGTEVELVGFGLTDDAARGSNTAEHAATVAVTDPTCASADGCRPAIAPGGELAAGGDGVDSCSGDSGGPVYLETAHGAVAIGVVSRAIGGATTACGDGGIYVRVDKVASWIADVAGGVTLDQCKAALDAGDDSSTATDDAIHEGCSTTRGDGGLLLAAIVMLSGAVRRRCPRAGRTRPSLGRDGR